MTSPHWQVIAHDSTLKPSIIGSSDDIKTVIDMAYNLIITKGETLTGVTLKRTTTHAQAYTQARAGVQASTGKRTRKGAQA